MYYDIIYFATSYRNMFSRNQHMKKYRHHVWIIKNKYNSIDSYSCQDLGLIMYAYTITQLNIAE